MNDFVKARGSSSLFSVPNTFYLDDAIRTWKMGADRRFKLNEFELLSLLYADDQILLYGSENFLVKISNGYNLSIPAAKTNTFCIKQPIRIKIVLNNCVIEKVKVFDYLRCSQSDYLGCEL